MRYASLMLIPLIAMAQIVNPNAKPKPGYKLEIKPGPVVPGRITVEKEPGDDIAMRPDGSIVAVSRSRAFTFPVTNRMDPQVRVSYQIVNGLIQYDYTVANGPGAGNAIDSFMLSINSPAKITTPEPWRYLRVDKPNEEPKIGFFRFVKDQDRIGKLGAGGAPATIRVVSGDAPGLIEATFHPNPLEQGAMQAAGGEFFATASPWVQQRLADLDTPDGHRVRRFVIGPVAHLRTDSVDNVRRSVENALQLPELKVIREQMAMKSVPADSVSLMTWLSEVRKASSDGFIADFTDAMMWRLRQLR